MLGPLERVAVVPGFEPRRKGRVVLAVDESVTERHPQRPELCGWLEAQAAQGAALKKLVAARIDEARQRAIESDDEGIDLSEAMELKSWAVAYAAATVNSEDAAKAVLGIGSDDDIKVWLNGELVFGIYRCAGES